MSTLSLSRESISNAFYKYGLYITLAVLVLVFSLLNSNFFNPANVVNLLQQTASTGIAAAGLVFVMVAGGIDVSMGSTIFLSSVITATFANQGVGLVGSFAVAMACGMAVGVFNAFFIAILKMVPLIVTLATLFIVRGLALAMTGVQSVFFFNDVADSVAYTRIGGVIPVVVIILVIALLAIQLILSRTLFGRQLFAMGHNRRAARVMGIKVTRNTFIAYVVAGGMAGLAGLVSGAQVGAITPTFAEGQEFIIITATILGGVSLFGGKGSAFPGAFLGVLIVMAIENGLVMAGANVYSYGVIRGAVIFIAVMLDCLRNTGETR